MIIFTVLICGFIGCWVVDKFMQWVLRREWLGLASFLVAVFMVCFIEGVFVILGLFLGGWEPSLPPHMQKYFSSWPSAIILFVLLTTLVGGFVWVVLSPIYEWAVMSIQDWQRKRWLKKSWRSKMIEQDGFETVYPKIRETVVACSGLGCANRPACDHVSHFESGEKYDGYIRVSECPMRKEEY